MSAGSIFTAAMVQMRTGLLPEQSLEQGFRLIREAAAQGADYVLTPEVSNMMQLNRKALFEHLAAEEDDLSLKAYRALAAELKIHLHIGSLALRFSPEKAVNRSFLIGPDSVTALSNSSAISPPGTMFGFAFSAAAGTPASNCWRRAVLRLLACNDWVVPEYMAAL